MECINCNKFCIGKNGKTFKIRKNGHASEVKCKQSSPKIKYCYTRLSKKKCNFYFDIEKM